MNVAITLPSLFPPGMTVPDDSSKRERRTFITQPTGDVDRAEPVPTTGKLSGRAKVDGDLKENLGVAQDVNSNNTGQNNGGSGEHQQVSDHAYLLDGS